MEYIHSKELKSQINLNGGFHYVICLRSYCHLDVRADRQEVRSETRAVPGRSIDVPDWGIAGGCHEGVHEGDGQQFACADDLHRHGLLVRHAPDDV